MFYIKGNLESELLNVVDKFIPTPLQYVILSYLNVRENLNISLVNKFFNVTSIRDAYWLHYIYIDENFNKKEFLQKSYFLYLLSLEREMNGFNSQLIFLVKK